MSKDEVQSDPSAELEAMGAVLAAVKGLPNDAVARVLNWVAETTGVPAPVSRTTGAAKNSSSTEADSGAGIDASDVAMGCSDAASFVDASGASDGNERALAVAYWIQKVEGNETWAGADVNKELKHQGHGLANVTKTMSRLMAKKPALVVQLKKSGTSKQARKLYKLTTAGEKAVVEMFSDAKSE